MNFKSFLLEYSNSVSDMATYRKLLLTLDAAHVSYENDVYEFNLGAVVKDDTLRALRVRVQLGTQQSVRLVRHGGNYVVVVLTDKMPERIDLVEMFATSNVLMTEFVSAIRSYRMLVNAPKTIVDANEKTSARKALDDNYYRLIRAVEATLSAYNTELDDLTAKETATVNIMKKLSIKLAKKNLATRYFGDTVNTFLKNVYKDPHAAFIRELNVDDRRKIDSRLKSYYERHVAPRSTGKPSH